MASQPGVGNGGPSQEKQVTPGRARQVVTVKAKGVWSLIGKGRVSEQIQL